MQKTIRILAVVAAALMGISLFLLLITIPFQSLYAETMGYPNELTNMLPCIPLLPMLFCLFRLVCAVLLLAFCGKQKGGIWAEVIVFIAFVVLLPIVSLIATSVHIVVLGNFGGSDLTIANSIASSLANHCTAPANLGQAIAYLVCGMSIVHKKMCKHTERTPETTEEIPA